MDLIIRYIHIAAHDDGASEYWLFPFGGDIASTEENETVEYIQQKRKLKQEARLRLFKRFGDIRESSTGYGYILKVDENIDNTEV